MRQILKIQEVACIHVSNLSLGAASEKVTQAKHRIEEVKKFRELIADEVTDLMERQQAIKLKITNCVKGKKNISGFLTHTAEAYESCFGEVDIPLLTALMHEDMMHWETIS